MDRNNYFLYFFNHYVCDNQCHKYETLATANAVS